MYGERANLYENLWAEMKAYTRRLAASETPLAADGELDDAFREFLIVVEAPALPPDAREFYYREFAQLVRDLRRSRSAKVT